MSVCALSEGECGNLHSILHLTHTSHTSADVVSTSCRAHLIILPTHPRWLKVTLKRDICCTCVHSTLLNVCQMLGSVQLSGGPRFKFLVLSFVTQKPPQTPTRPPNH